MEQCTNFNVPVVDAKQHVAVTNVDFEAQVIVKSTVASVIELCQDGISYVEFHHVWNYEPEEEQNNDHSSDDSDNGLEEQVEIHRTTATPTVAP